VSVWCPENLDVGRLLAAFGRRTAEGALWLGHCVLSSLTDDARCRDTGRAHLRTDYLRKIVGRHQLDAVRDAARQIGYIERGRSYRAGTRSQAYWILPPYDHAALVRHRVMHPALRDNIRSWREAQRRETWERIERGETPVAAAVCRHLCWNLQRVRLDAEMRFPEPLHPAHQISAEQIRQGELRFKVDPYGRIHTNLTNLPKLLRPYLSVDGGRLANVDISESQPLFFGIALANIRAGRGANNQQQARHADQRHPCASGRDEARRREREAGGGGGEEEGKKGTPAATLMLANTMLANTMLDNPARLAGGFDRDRLPGDLRRYLELCECRALYQTVADRLGTTRDAAKRRVMVALFDKPWHRNAVCEALGGLFPTVMADMREIKRPDHRRLAHFAQRIESAFMFGRVVPRIMRERPDLFISTIHDSILTPVADAQFVRAVTLDEFAQLGVSPQVKIEPCSPAVRQSPDPTPERISPKST
jgi:hypothetical protein